MTDALVPVFANRPPIINVGGCTVYLSIRDQEYFRIKTILKAAVVAAHPDKHPRGRPQATLFRAALCRLNTWLRVQRGIYWALDQMPPDWKGPLTPPQGRVPVAKVAGLLIGKFETARFKGAHCSAGAEVFPSGVHAANRSKL